MCGTSQRFPPAHFNGGLSLGILLAFEVGAGGETRTLMRSEPRQILSLVRIPISPLRLRCSLDGQVILVQRPHLVNPPANGSRYQGITAENHIKSSENLGFRLGKECLPASVN